MKAGIVRGSRRMGLVRLLDDQLDLLRASVLRLGEGECHVLDSGECEIGLLLIRGACELTTEAGRYALGPRHDPLLERPWVFSLGPGGWVRVRAKTDCTLGIGGAIAGAARPDCLITPEKTGGGPRGEGCFAREVRFSYWNDNSPGERLMIGETIIPPGHWSSFPPHKHDAQVEGAEAAYEEAYYFEFDSPGGFALVRQYDRSGFDQAVVARHGDIAYMGFGYHPVVNSPACWAYQLTLMAGSSRMSLASLDPDFRSASNPYQDQRDAPMSGYARIFATSDTHGLRRLGALRDWADQARSSDLLLHAGDSEILDSTHGGKVLSFLTSLPCDVALIDGNHDDYAGMLRHLREAWRGDAAHRMARNVWALERGAVYDLGGWTMLAFGGAMMEGYAPGAAEPPPGELPTAEEFRRALGNLSARAHRVNLILTHDGPERAVGWRAYDPVRPFLQSISDANRFDLWLFGHQHQNRLFGPQLQCVYDRVVPVRMLAP